MEKVMTLEDALTEVDQAGLKERLNTTDIMTLARLLMTNVNEAFALGRLDKEVVG